MPPLNAPQYTPVTGIGTISPDKKWKYTQQGWVKNEPTPPITPPAPTIPQGKGPADNLVEYKSVVNQAVQLARDKRSELMLRFMGAVAPSGTMAASDFNSILSGMQRAGERTVEMATKDILERQTPVYDTFTSDGNLYEVQKDPVTKQIIGTPRLIQEGKIEVALTPEDRRNLIGVGFSPSEINQIESDVLQYSLDEVLEGITDSKQIKAIQKVYGVEGVELTRENVAKLYGLTDDDTKTGWLGFGKTNKEKLDEIMDAIQKYRDIGYKDADILKLIK